MLKARLSLFVCAARDGRGDAPGPLRGKASCERLLSRSSCSPTTLAMANVFDMPPGLTSLEMVTVGNPGNAGEISVRCRRLRPRPAAGLVAYIVQHRQVRGDGRAVLRSS